MFWCNGPSKGCSHSLQVDVGTSGRTEDDDALSSDWPGNDAVFASWYSSRSAVTRGWSRWTGCSFPYAFHIERQAAISLSCCCSAERVDVLAVVRGSVDCELLEVDLWTVVWGTVDDELLAGPHHILQVEKPVNISTVVQGTVSCRLMAAVPSC